MDEKTKELENCYTHEVEKKIEVQEEKKLSVEKMNISGDEM